jgi:type IV pilus assembly protein PilX
MANHQHPPSRMRHHENGAALVVSLILLLLMAIVGIAAMNGARLEVSMAGLMQQEEVVFRGAERVLTAAEDYVNSTEGVFDPTVAGHYLPEDALNAAVRDWADPEILSVEAANISEIGEHDKVVVEYLGVMTLPGSVQNDGGDPPIPGDKANVYRITTRSDINGKSVRIIESIFTKPYNPAGQ